MGQWLLYTVSENHFLGYTCACWAGRGMDSGEGTAEATELGFDRVGKTQGDGEKAEKAMNRPLEGLGRQAW